MKLFLLATTLFFAGISNASTDQASLKRNFHQDFDIQKCILDTNETALICHGNHSPLNQTMFAIHEFSTNETTYILAGKSLSDQVHPPFKDYGYQDFLGLIVKFSGNTMTVHSEVNIKLRAFWTDIRNHRATNGNIEITIDKKIVRANDFGYVPI